MKKIMDEVWNLESYMYRVNHFSGKRVMTMFGNLKDVLGDWTPDEDKWYRCWWGLSDQGCDLIYMEELEKEDELDLKLRLGNDIVDMVRGMDIDKLETVVDFFRRQKIS